MSSNESHGVVWALQPGAAVFSFITSGSRGWAKYYAERGSTFVRVGNLNRNAIELDLDEIQFVEPPRGTEGERTRVQPGDLLISITADIGMVAVASENLGPAFVNQHVAIARPNEDVEPKYLAWFIASESNGQKQLKALQRGATKLGLGLDDIRSLQFPLPGITTQRRIVAKLEELFSELDAGVEALRRAQRRLARYRQALLQAAVTGKLTREWREQQTHDIQLGKLNVDRPAWLPLGWDWTTLGEASEVTGGLTKNQRRPALSRQVPYLRVANVYADELRLEEVEKIGIQEGELRRALLQKEDLLIVEGNGSLDQIGRVAIWDGSIDPCVHQNHLIKARLSERVLPRFALLWLLSPLGRDAIVDQASSTSGLHTLSISKVSGLPLPIPPMQEQHAIVAEYDRQNSLADALRATTKASLRRAERLRQSILERAFRGELVPQDSNDEPAEALLARLKATAPDAPAPRRRGRPPKAEPAEPQAPRRHGRPRKAAPLASGGSA